MSIDELVSNLARRDVPRTEAVVQADVRQLLLTAPLGLTDVMLETPLGDRRRIDVEVGSAVIEVKKDLRQGNVLSDAVDQLAGYVEAREQQYGRRYVGVLTDGCEWRCYHMRDGGLVEVSKIVVSATKPDVDALWIWLEGVLATARDVPPTPLEIERRLGAGTSAHALDRASLLALYRLHAEDPVVRTKRRLWSRLLETALGTQFKDDDALFVEHTLLVNIAEIIAHAVIGLDPTSLVPLSIVSGSNFDSAGVHGVVEADFFDWVVELPRGDAFIRTLARRIARFDWDKVEYDVLKALYESVIEAETRKKLGEYYTPDWLAEQVVTTAVPQPLGARVLDPACGSGTFLFHGVRRYLEAAAEAGQDVRTALEGVTRHVVGMDLHPVAVTLARVTYLLAIGRTRLSQDRGPIRVPVFLGDSMQWREKNPTLWSTHELTIPVDDQRDLTPSEFKFPHVLLENAQKFDDLVSNLADLAAKRKPGSKVPALTGLLQRLTIPAALHPPIVQTFETMCRLHDEGRDHIWGYYIRNLARPEWLARPENRADVLVGNPPWLSYRCMPPTMQRDFKELSEERGLWLGARHAPSQDLAALFFVRMMELYLKDEGQVAFVMPSGIINGGQHRGFRTGKFGVKVLAALGPVWDLRRLRPHFFPITASVVQARRAAKAVPLPREPEVWSGRVPAGNASWAAASKSIQRKTSKAKVAVEKRSEYHARFRQGATIVPRVLFLVEKQAAGPLGQVANKVAIRSARSSNEKAPWKHLEALDGVVESEFLYRIHLGETVLPYRTLEPRLAVLPLHKNTFLSADSTKLQFYAGLSDWWTKASEAWMRHRASDRLTLEERVNYHGLLLGQIPPQPERIVYGKAGMHVAAARVSDHRALIDHKLYWASASCVEEAQFLIAILNAPETTTRVRPLMSYGKDERDVDKYVWSLPIPMFDPAIKEHAELAKLGAQAEREIATLVMPDEHFASARRRIRDWLESSELGDEINRRVATLMGA